MDNLLKLKNIAQQLAPVKIHGYFVFHDAYGYFENVLTFRLRAFYGQPWKFSRVREPQ